MNINNDNYELWLLRYAEQELTEAERKEVEQWLATHPEAADEVALYAEAPRLESDADIHCEAPIPLHSEPLWPVAIRWTAAAAVVAALMVPAMHTVVAPKLEPPLVAEKLDNPERLENLERLENQDNQKITSHPANESITPVLLAESIPTEQNDTVAEPTEGIVPEIAPSTQQEIIQPTYIVVDDLIVFEDEIPDTASENDILADAVETYTRSTSNINPIGHFISTFIKANK
ncbi:MAG: hypothetical protein IKR33_04620 [Bacteroidales bacterium]|nr:hypothetical protein [Bacteroidales bacterium]